MREKQRCNQEGKDLLKANLDCKLKAYELAAGKWEIGWGHIGDDIKEGTVWTQQQADDRFEARIKECEDAIKRLVTVELNENQHSALVSLLYSAVEGIFPKSCMLKYLNDNKFDKAAAEFLKWNHEWTGELDDKGEKIWKFSQKFATLSVYQKTLFETLPKPPAGPKKVDSASPSAAALSSSLNANQVATPSNNVGQGNFSESTPMQPASCLLQPVEPELPPASTAPSVDVPAANSVDPKPADSEAVDAQQIGSAPPASPSAAVAEAFSNSSSLNVNQVAAPTYLCFNVVQANVSPPTPVQLANCLCQPVQVLLPLAPTSAAAPAAALSNSPLSFNADQLQLCPVFALMLVQPVSATPQC